jgi:sec-independent protein translocase protein TatA
MGFSVTHLLVVLAIVMVLFGTKSLRNIGSDLGGAIKGFRTAVKVGEGDEEDSSADKDEVIEGEVTAKKPIKINV